MTGNSIKMEILSGPERRRRWSTAEKLAIVHETYEADATVSLVARRHGIAPNQLFAWRKLASQGALVATAAEEEVVPASESPPLERSPSMITALFRGRLSSAMVVLRRGNHSLQCLAAICAGSKKAPRDQLGSISLDGVTAPTSPSASTIPRANWTLSQ